MIGQDYFDLRSRLGSALFALRGLAADSAAGEDQTPTIDTLIKNLFNRHLTKPDTVPFYGFVGDPGTLQPGELKLEETQLDSTHPPTAQRIRVIDERPPTPPEVEVEPQDEAAIRRELLPLEQPYSREQVAAARDRLYR